MIVSAYFRSTFVSKEKSSWVVPIFVNKVTRWISLLLWRKTDLETALTSANPRANLPHFLTSGMIGGDENQPCVWSLRERPITRCRA